MSKPNDIPQDVWDRSLSAFDEMCRVVEGSDDREIIARAILAAKAEEREACAVKAEQYPFRSFERQEPDKSVYGWARCRREIAAAIRQRGKP